MTLLNDLYDLQDACIDLPQARFSVRLREDCSIYRAHFPDMPVTPGVCIVQMAVELLSRAVGRKLKLASIKNAKFITAMTPLSPVITVSINKIKIEGNAVSARVELTDAAPTVYAKISLQADIA